MDEKLLKEKMAVLYIYRHLSLRAETLASSHTTKRKTLRRRVGKLRRQRLLKLRSPFYCSPFSSNEIKQTPAKWLTWHAPKLYFGQLALYHKILLMAVRESLKALNSFRIWKTVPKIIPQVWTLYVWVYFLTSDILWKWREEL